MMYIKSKRGYTLSFGTAAADEVAVAVEVAAVAEELVVAVAEELVLLAAVSVGSAGQRTLGSGRQ